MTIIQALEIVLDLARENSLDDQNTDGNEALEEQVHKQHEAIFEMEHLMEDFQNFDKVVIHPQEEIVHA